MKPYLMSLFRLTCASVVFLLLSISDSSGVQPSDATSPNLTSISGSSTSPILRWYPFPGAVRYELQVAYDAGFTSLVLDDPNLVDTVRTIGPLTPDTGYYCRVLAFTTGGTTNWSNILLFYAQAGKDVFTLPAQIGWNLISLPLNVSDAARNFLFPGTCSNPTAFCYTGSYGCCIGPGYFPFHSYGFWVRFPELRVLGVTGIPLMADTEAIMDGWNLIGSIFNPIPASSVSTIPPGLITGNIFGYTFPGYDVAATIQPYKGYWVRANGPGQIIFSQSTQSLSQIVAYVHWQDQPVEGKKIVLVETGDTLHTDSAGLAKFTVPAGNYTVRAFEINRGGPILLSIDFNVATLPGEVTTVDIVDCLPCL